MNNFIIGLKRFFTNKNVVTVLLVLVALVLLFVGYNSAIKSQTKPVNLPVAAHQIAPRTKITSEDIVFQKVSNSMLNEKVIRSNTDILGKYTNIYVTIPEGSPFYAGTLINEAQVPGNWVEEIKKMGKNEVDPNSSVEYEAYYMDTDFVATLGNSVTPNSYIDLYMKVTDENGQIMFGRLLENIKVLVVHDGSGKNVFETSEDGSDRSPSKLGFALSREYYILLSKIKFLGISLTLVPQGLEDPKAEVNVPASTLRDYVDMRTITVEEDTIAKPIVDSITNQSEEAKTVE